MATAIASSASGINLLRGPQLDVASDFANHESQRIHGTTLSCRLRKPFNLENPPKRRNATWRCKAYVEHGFDLYALLGVDSTASLQEIRRSYRWLQKKCHPDVAGPVGHDMSILLNEAYTTLVDPDRRATYDQLRADSAEFDGYNGQPIYSKWCGPANEDRAVFVDETQCVGCLKCALIASKTFAIETRYGRARAVGQWADPEPVIDDAIRACPVDCISWVDRSKLAALEYIMSKQPRFTVGIDVQNNGGVRTENVFKATDKFIKKHRQRESVKKSTLQETAAQKEARLAAMDGVQARAGRWWYHLVGKNMSEDAILSKIWDTNVARASQRAIVPSSYYKTETGAIESIDDSNQGPGNDGGLGHGGSSLPDELERLFEAAARRRRGMPMTGPGMDDEYWVPIELSSCAVPITAEEKLSNLGQDKSTRKDGYSWTWTGSLNMDDRVNLWVKGLFSGIPMVISAVAAMLVGFTSGTDAALSETEVMGPLPTDWISCIEMQVLLTAAVWYMVGAVVTNTAFLMTYSLHWSTKKNNLHKQ